MRIDKELGRKFPVYTNYYTVKEVAEILKVVEETVRKKLRSGEIKGIRPGLCWMIPEKSIQKYLKGGQAK